MKKLILILLPLLTGLSLRAQTPYLNVTTDFSPTVNASCFYYQMFFENNQFLLMGKNGWNPSVAGVSQSFYARFSAQGDSLGFSQIMDTASGHEEYWGGFNSTYRYNPLFPLYNSFTYGGNASAVSVLYKLDSAMNLQLVHTFQDTVGIGLNGCFQTMDDKLISFGQIKTSGSDSYIHIIKHDKTGNILWSKSIPNTGGACYLWDGFPLYTGDAVLSGWNSSEPVALCLDTAGGTKWIKYFQGGSSTAWVEPTPDSALMVAFDSLTPSAHAVLKLIKLNPLSGEVLWQKAFDFDSIESYTQAFRVSSKGEALIAGWQNNWRRVYYLKISSGGQMEFFHYSPVYTSVRLDDIIECGEGVACCGYIKPTVPTPAKAWFFTTDRFGCMTPNCPSSIEENNEPQYIKELSISPNPAKENVTVTSTQSYHNASLMLYNIIGRKSVVYSWPEGECSMQLNVRRFPRGTYQLILITNTPNKEVGKMVVE